MYLCILSFVEVDEKLMLLHLFARILQCCECCEKNELSACIYDVSPASCNITQAASVTSYLTPLFPDSWCEYKLISDLLKNESSLFMVSLVVVI